MIETICTPYGEAAFPTAVKCDGCGKRIEFWGTVADGNHYCAECSTPANQEFRICNVCGLPMFDGFTDLDGFYCHDGCFEQAMDAEFPAGWRQVEDDGCDGYYEWYDPREQEWCGTGIFWTEWY